MSATGGKGWLPSKEEEESWSEQMWLEWRRSEGLDELTPIDKPTSGPDRIYRDSCGRVVGVEITRVIDGADREHASFAVNCLLREVAPLVEGRVPSTIFAEVELPWSIPQRRRQQVAEVLAEAIVAVSESLAEGESAPCVLNIARTSVDLTILRGTGTAPQLRLGSLGWPVRGETPEGSVDAVIRAIRRKARRGQLAIPGNVKILLLHDRMPGIREQALAAAVRAVEREGILGSFDEIFLVDTYEPGRCLRAWPSGE